MFESLSPSEKKHYIKLSRMLGNINKNKSTIKTEVYRTNNPKKYHGTLHKVLLNYDLLVELVKSTEFMQNERLGAIIAHDIIIGRIKSREWESKFKKQLNGVRLKNVEKYVYIRINTLKASKEDFSSYKLIETCVKDVYRIVDPEDSDSNYKTLASFYLDQDLVEKYKIQNLSSCLPAFILNPEENSTVIDAAAAPGNKTTHLSSIMNNMGKIYAVEKDPERCRLLETQVESYGSKNIEVICGDFLALDPYEYEVDYILLDPSCSGSGIHLNYKKDQARVDGLHSFQVKMLNHALNFCPKKVVYSVCSVHQEEGEDVIRAVLESNKDYELEKIGDFWHERGDESYEFYEKVIRADGKDQGLNGFFVALLKRK